MPAARSRGRADEAGPKPRADAYVGLLGVSLLALSAAILFAFLTYNQLSEKSAKMPQMGPVGGGMRMTPPTGPGVAPAPSAPGVAPPGQMPPGAQPGGSPVPGKAGPPGGNPPPPGGAPQQK